MGEQTLQLAVPRVAGPSVPRPAADARGATLPSVHVPSSGFSIRAAGVEHIFWQKTQFLRGNLSFGKSESSDFCFHVSFAGSSAPPAGDGAFRRGTSPAPAPCSSTARGWGQPGDSPVLGHRKGGCWGLLPLLLCRGVPKNHGCSLTFNASLEVLGKSVFFLAEMKEGF